MSIVESADFKKGFFRIGFFTDTHIHHTNPRSRVDDYTKAILGKVSDILQMADEREWDLILFGGDLFHATLQPFDLVCKVFHLLNSSPVPIYGIIGNHDYRGNIDRLSYSATGLVYAGGSLMRRLDSVHVECDDHMVMNIKGMDYDDNPVVPESKESCTSILVTHQFLSPFFDADGVLDKKEIAKKGWHFVLSGHDHSTYPTVNMEGVVVIRPGALSRGTKAVSDRMRDVCVAELSLCLKSATITQKLIPLKVAGVDSIFSEVRMERESMKKDIVQFSEYLTQMKNEDTEEDIMAVIESLTDDVSVIEYCRNYLSGEGVI